MELFVTKVWHGHWDVEVRKDNYKRKYPHNLSSTTIWTYRTTDSISVDNYHSDEDYCVKKGKKSLIKQAKLYGRKSTIFYKKY